MRNYIILNNKKSDTISGLIIQELPPISKPAQRTQIETIDGRDGDIVTPLGYAAYDKTFTIGLYGTFDINEVIAYFATKGTVIFSNEPDKYYYYQIVDQIDYERLVRYKVATVTMHVQPFKYSSTETPIIVDSSDTVSGEGSNIALANTAEAPFNTLRHKGNATQKTLSGKNLFDGVFRQGAWYGTAVQTRIFTTQELKVIANQTYTISTNLNTSNYKYAIALRSTPYDGTGTPSLSYDSGWKTAQTFTFKPNEDGYFGISVAKSDTTSNLTPSDIQGATWQLEIGSTGTDYEEFCGGIPSPSPDYPQDIQVLTGDSTITIDDGGENSQEYVIPFGDTYLVAIGDYADEPVKVDGTWKIRRAIGKVVITESSSFQNNCFVYNSLTDITVAPQTDNIIHTISDQYIGATTRYRGDGQLGTIFKVVGNNYQIAWRDRRYTTSGSKTDMDAWLAAHPLAVYYTLATPTDEAITDQDLIDALDAFYDQAHAYKGQTNITASAADGNAPAVLSVDVNEDNESTVTNAGNTTSRPILTIYGQGNIGVYINDVEVLQVALGDEGYITLDSVEMEAYKDTTANLKNRLVTGDYSKLALNAGANKIRFTGIVTKYEISKYSRWL